MNLVLTDGRCFELGGNNVIVGGPDRNLFGAVLRNTEGKPRLTLIGGEDVVLDAEIEKVE